MRCASCGAEIKDEAPSFCPRCGASLGSTETEATTELRVSASEDAGSDDAGSEDTGARADATEEQLASSKTDHPPSTERLSVPAESRETVATPHPNRSLVTDLLGSIGSSLRRQGTGDLVVAALFGFLLAVLVGGVLVAAARLQYPFLGEGASSYSVLTAIVITGVGLLGAPVAFGDLTVSALPLGAISVVGLGVVWASKRVVTRGPAVRTADSVRDGMKVAIPFAALFWLAALIFRIREQPTEVGADPWAALLLAALWGALFGAIGGLLSVKPLVAHIGDAGRAIAERGRPYATGISAAVVMLVVCAALVLLAAVSWVIVGLLSDDAGLTAGEVAAGVLYLLAFGPNVLVAIAAVAHGAPVEVGAQISASGRAIGNLESVSLASWGDGSAPWFVFVLLVIPVAAGLLGGFYARRSSRAEDREIHVLGSAAVAYGVVLGLLAAMSEARLGAGLIRERGFGKVSPDPLWLAFLAVAWALLAGYVGWRLAESAASSPAGRAGAADKDAGSDEEAGPEPGEDEER